MSLDLTSDFLQNNFAMPEASKNGMYTFDRYKLDAEKLMLYRDEIEIKLPPKVVKTLAVLIEHRGSILSKDELIEKVWADAIVEESNLSQNLYVLRKSLGSRPDGFPYIETLRRRGYRFTADVQLVERSSDLLNGSQAPAPRPSVGVERRGNVLRLVDWSAAQMPDEARVPAATHEVGVKKSKVWIALLGAACLIVGIIAAGSFYLLSGRNTGPRKELSVVRLTNGVMPGGATISPDGNYLVYHELLDGEISRLFVQQVGQSSRLEIASSASDLFHVSTFSPDARFVYFVTGEKLNGETSLNRVPTIGGTTTRILKRINGPVSFSRDGAQMVFVRSSGSSDESELIITDSDGKAERVLLSRISPNRLGGGAAWSPDGSSIAFSEVAVHETGAGPTNRILLADSSSGAVRELSPENWSNVYRMEWTADGEGLLFIGTRAKEAYSTRRDQVYLISHSDGISRRITSDGNRHEPGSLGATKSGAILAVTGNRSSQVWSMNPNGDQATAVQLSRGAADGRAGLCPLPDGRLGYMTRTGEDLNILLANADGSDTKQLATGLTITEELRADPNGKFFVFSTVENGTNRLFRVDVDGTNVKQLTFGDEEVDSSISPDGQSVVYGTVQNRNGVPYFELFRVPSEGGEASQVGSAECFSPSYSPDGTMISCIGPNNDALILSASDGSEIKRFRLPANVTSNFGTGWMPDSSAVTLIINDKGASNIWVYPIKRSKPYQLTNFSSGIIYRFALSPDGERLYLARGYPVQDAVLITNYR